MRERAYQNTVLTVIAVLLAANILERPGAAIEPAAAHAQMGGNPDPRGLTNALEQRKQMIAELRQLSSKIDRIEAKLNAGLNVKVTEMPAMRQSDQGGQ